MNLAILEEVALHGGLKSVDFGQETMAACGGWPDFATGIGITGFHNVKVAGVNTFLEDALDVVETPVVHLDKLGLEVIDVHVG